MHPGCGRLRGRWGRVCMCAAARVLALLLRGLRAVLRSPHFILYVSTPVEN